MAYSATETKPAWKRHRRWISLKSSRLPAVIALSVILLILLVTIFAPLTAPYPPDKQDLANSLQGASSHHLLGTDKLGRDILSRVIYGARTTLLGAFVIVLISTLIGVPLGLISGYVGKYVDSLIMRVWDILLAFPSLLLAFAIVAVFGRGLGNTVITLGILYTPMISRLTRSVTLVEKNQTYVEAARALGYSPLRIMFRHILPNCVSAVLVQITIDFAYAILDLAAMSFLGLGVQPPTSDWGSMLSEGREYLLISPNMALAPGIAIMLTVVSFNLLGDSLQVILDPKQRKVQE